MKIWIACGLGLLVWVPGLAQEPIRVGEEFQVNSYTTGNQFGSSVAVDPGGNFVVVWTSWGSYGTDNDEDSIQGQRFDSDGNPVGGEFQVNNCFPSAEVGHIRGLI